MKNRVKIVVIIATIAVIVLLMVGCVDGEDISFYFKIINENNEAIVKVDIHLFYYSEDWWDVNISKGESKTFITSNNKTINEENGAVTVYYGDEFKCAEIYIKFEIGKTTTLTLTADGELK
jgi:hypothetical protein